jgi:hypothetical protein
LRDELLVAREYVCAILNEAAQCPQTKRCLAVLLDDVNMGIVYPTSHLAGLLDDSVDPLGEGVFEKG